MLDRCPCDAELPVMIPCFLSKHVLDWEDLELPSIAISRDWYGEKFDVEPTFCVACDDQSLWFVAHHGMPATAHPNAAPCEFHAELWRFDCAELFLANPKSGKYLELNISPNAAWWSCEFIGPRQRAIMHDIPIAGVQTWAKTAPDGAWTAAMAVPLDFLDDSIGFGSDTLANVTMILDSPSQKFVSALSLGSGDPDFHRPNQFRPLDVRQLPKN